MCFPNKIKEKWVISVVHQLMISSIVGLFPWVGGVLLLGYQTFKIFLEHLFDITYHWYVDTSYIVVPLHSETII